MRPAWRRQGRNFDPTHLDLFTATPGFILGESVLGVDELGGAGPDVEIDATFTSIQISSPTTVEDGLFVHREVETCSLSATLPEKMQLRNRWIAINYFGEELYRGRVSESRLTEAVEVWAQHKPGNTATKTYRVSLTATNDEERLPNMSTPPRTFTNETLAQRVASWTGLTVTTQAPAPDLPVNWANAAWDTSTIRKVYRGTDQLGSLLDTLRSEAKLRNMTVIYQPQAATPLILKPNNQWLSGDAKTALCFSDDPGHVLGQAVDPGDAFVHLGRYVSYTSRSIGEDLTLFRNAAAIRWGQYDVDSPPADGQPVETVFGPYRASGASTTDAVVDLGTIDVASPGSNPYWLSRAVAATLPLKANSRPFTGEVVAPFQSLRQLEGTVPGMALLESDGVVERVAVLGREHSITPDRWTIRYVLGPPHLLDRTSDFDPGTPEVHAPVAGPGAGQTTLEWVVPSYPTDTTIYEVIFNAAAATKLITSDQAVVSVVSNGVAPAPGTLRQLFVSGVAGTAYWVLYTSNTAPGSTNPSAIWREGPPAYLGAVL
jgi:hypothetical protein